MGKSMPRARLLLILSWGLCLLRSSRAQDGGKGLNVSCRYHGVFHVEKYGRYSLSREEGRKLCESFGTTLATLQQLEKAHGVGFQTCRYGWVQDKVAIARIEPHPLCAANVTGIIVLNYTAFDDKYDVYCFNASDTQEKVCDPLRKLLQIPTEEPDTSADSNAVPSTTATEPSTDGDNNNGLVVPDSIAHSTKPSETATKSEVNDVADVSTTVPPLNEEEKMGGGTPDITEPNEDSIQENDEQSFSSTLPPARDSTNDKDHPSNETKKGSRRMLDSSHSESVTSAETSRISSTAAPPSISTKHPSKQKNELVLPDWLIILAAILAVLIVLTICIIFTNRKKLCGKKKKLVITSTKGKGKNEPRKDKNKQEVNGETKKSEEMVQLMDSENTECQPKQMDDSVAVSVSDAEDPSVEDMKSSV